MGKLFTNEKETKQAMKAAVDQAEKCKGNHFKKMMPNQLRTHCARCGCVPKPDEWGDQMLHYCIDCI